jgi:Flp pilus assembly protein TadG
MLRLANTGESRTTLRSNRKERGQSLVEMAVALPIFLIIVLGIIDFGMGLKSWISITNAAREAARYGAVYCSAGDANTNDVKDRAVDASYGLGLTTGDVTVTNCATDTSEESLVVEVEYDYQLITPLGGLMSIFGNGMDSAITLRTSADMRVE